MATSAFLQRSIKVMATFWVPITLMDLYKRLVASGRSGRPTRPAIVEERLHLRQQATAPQSTLAPPLLGPEAARRDLAWCGHTACGWHTTTSGQKHPLQATAAHTAIAAVTTASALLRPIAMKSALPGQAWDWPGLYMCVVLQTSNFKRPLLVETPRAIYSHIPYTMSQIYV